MKKNPILLTAGSIVAAVFLTCAPQAMARDQVDWSITVGSGNPYPPPPVVHRVPQVVHHAPVYVAPAPVVQYGPYYGHHGHKHQWRERHHHRHHHHHHHRHRDWR